MKDMRISGLRPGFPASPPRRAKPQAPDAPAPSEPTQPPQRARAAESFISAVAAFRQPPEIALPSPDKAPSTSVGGLFQADLDHLETRSAAEVSATLAAAFLDHAPTAQMSGDSQLARAFETLGEQLRGYEHLRMLQTGSLG